MNDDELNVNDISDNETPNPQMLIYEQIHRDMQNTVIPRPRPQEPKKEIDYGDDENADRNRIIVGLVLLVVAIGLCIYFAITMFTPNSVKMDSYFIGEYEGREMSVVFFDDNTCRYNNNFLLNCNYTINHGTIFVTSDVEGYKYRFTYKIVNDRKIRLNKTEVMNVDGSAKKVNVLLEKSSESVVQKDMEKKKNSFVDSYFRELEYRYHTDVEADKLNITYLNNKSSRVTPNKCGYEYYGIGFAIYNDILYAEINPSSRYLNYYLVTYEIANNVRDVFTVKYFNKKDMCDISVTFVVMKNGEVKYLNNIAESQYDLLELVDVNINGKIKEIRNGEDDKIEFVYLNGDVDSEIEFSLGLGE